MKWTSFNRRKKKRLQNWQTLIIILIIKCIYIVQNRVMQLMRWKNFVLLQELLIECAYNYAQFQYTIKHTTVLISFLSNSRQSSQFKCCLLGGTVVKWLKNKWASTPHCGNVRLHYYRLIHLVMTLTSDLEKLFGNAHTHDEYLWQVSLKSIH